MICNELIQCGCVGCERAW